MSHDAPAPKWRRPGFSGAAVLLLATLGAGCTGSPDTITLGARKGVISQTMAKGIADVIAESAGVDVEVVATDGSAEVAERVASGEFQFGIASNSETYREGATSVLPVYTNVLHLLVNRSVPVQGDLGTTLRGRTVFAGAPGDNDRAMLSMTLDAFGVGETDFTFDEASDPAQSIPDVVWIFSPVTPEAARRFQSEYRIVGLCPVEELGNGSVIDALALIHPQLEPFVLPQGTYPAVHNEPLATLSVETLLLANKDLSEPLVLQTAESLIRNRQALGEVHMAMFSGIREGFDRTRLSFPLHEGARQYLDRDVPGFAERYAELVGVLFSMSLALITGGIGLLQWRDRRRKNRVDVHYITVLRIRESLDSLDSADKIQGACDQLRALESDAFKQLTDEKVAADDAFRILIQLLTDVRVELREARRRLGGTDG